MFSLLLVQNLLQRGARPALQVILLVTFLFFFGLPAIKTYQKKEVMVVESKRDSNEIPFQLQLSLNVSKDMWTEDSTNYWAGRYYTPNFPLTIGPNDEIDQIYILLSNISLFY